MMRGGTSSLTEKNFEECACDAYEALRLIQQHGAKAIAYARYWADVRQLAASTIDQEHYSSFAIDEAVKRGVGIGLPELKTKTPSELLDLALEIAREKAMDQDALLDMGQDFRKFRYVDKEGALVTKNPAIAERFREAIRRRVNLNDQNDINLNEDVLNAVSGPWSSPEAKIRAKSFNKARKGSPDDKIELMSLILTFRHEYIQMNSDPASTTLDTLLKPFADYDVVHKTDCVKYLKKMVSDYGAIEFMDRLKRDSTPLYIAQLVLDVRNRREILLRGNKVEP